MKKLLLICVGLMIAGCNNATPGMVDCWDGCSEEPIREIAAPTPPAQIIEVPVATPGPVVVIPGPTVFVPAPAPTAAEDILGLIDSENEYRLSLGQSILSDGLSCTLSTVTGGDRIQASIAGHNTLTGIVSVATYTLLGAFNQPDSPASDGLNVIPPALRPLYTNLYMLRCTGKIVIRETGYHNFTVRSDDASVLYINGSKTVDNDNSHGPTDVSGARNLRRGVYDFRIDFAQTGGGSQALIISMDGLVVSGSLLYH